MMQIQVLSIQPQSNQETFTVAIQMGQAVEEFCLTAKDTLVGAQPAHLIQGDEHFENTFAHLEGLRGQISSDVVDLLLLRQGLYRRRVSESGNTDLQHHPQSFVHP